MRLLDGPAEGVYLTRRSPRFLRAVLDVDGVRKDVLNELQDTPAADEVVYVYELVPGTVGNVHLSLSPRSRSGFYVTGDYQYLPHVDGEALRDNDVWAAWCKERAVLEGADA
jgi:hypothetical protein